MGPIELAPGVLRLHFWTVLYASFITIGMLGFVFLYIRVATERPANFATLFLQDNLLAQGVDIRQLPVVFQYNKQDLPRDLILTREEMDDALNFRAVQSFSADALHGTGVFETLKGISEHVLKRLAAGSAVA